LVIDGVARWSPKWKSALRKEISNLPESLASLVTDAEPATAVAPDDDSTEDTEPASEATNLESAAEDVVSDADEEDEDREGEADDGGEYDGDGSAAAEREESATTTSGRRVARRERGRLRRLGKSVAQAAANEANGAPGEGDAAGRRDKSPRFDVREALR